MTPPPRPAAEAFRRGLSALVANPGLILAPLSFAAVLLGGIAVPVFLLVLGLAGWHRGRLRISDIARDAEALLPRLESFLEGLLAAPFVLIGGLLFLLVLLLLATVFAAYLRAGITGSLVAIDRHAVEDAHLPAFRRPGLWAVFRGSARRLFGRFFALVNLYALAVSFLVLLLVLPFGLVVLGAMRERGGFVAGAFVLFFLFLPLVIGGAIALRVLYLVSCRLAATDDVDALEAVARAVSLIRASLSRVVLLYLLTLAAGFVSGFAFLVPRFALSYFAGRSLVLFIAGTGLLMVAQMLVSFGYDLAVTGAFVSLWPVPSGESPPPVVLAPDGDAPPVLV
ncbi:MAG TPA: hypothetical protein VLJ18_03660 [Thermoanaerobaculia bacterium]|nr:hypothetical protein [Thermoanaerobaculia bacterium]